jgi:hypothetical protein
LQVLQNLGYMQLNLALLILFQTYSKINLTNVTTPV